MEISEPADVGGVSANLAGARIRLSGDVVVGPALRRGSRAVHYLKRSGSSSFFRVGDREAFLIQRLDGIRTVDEISAEYLARFHRRLGQSNWRSLLNALATRGFLAGTDQAPTEAAPATLAPRSAALRKLLLYRIPLARVPRLIDGLSRRLTFFFLRPVFLTLVALSLAACGYVLTHVGQLWRVWHSSPNYGPVTVAAFAVLWLSVLAHEVGHGVAAARYGGRAQEFGLMWRFPLLVPYCKVDDIVLFAKRGQRVATAFAGTFVSLLATLPFAALWLWGPQHAVVHDWAGATLVVTVIGGLGNLLPIFQLDGYAIVNHSLGMLDLRSDTYVFWGQWIRRRTRLADYPMVCRVAYLGYGLFGMAFLATAAGVLAVVAARMRHLSSMLTMVVGWTAAAAGVAVMVAIVITSARYAAPGGSAKA